MWYPNSSIIGPMNQEIIKFVIALLDNEEVKAALAKRIRVEIDTQRYKYDNTSRPSYESLTSGSVNMQNRMAASGYDTYGTTILSANKSANNKNVYKKMKNQIKYGAAPSDGYRRRGQRDIF